MTWAMIPQYIVLSRKKRKKRKKEKTNQSTDCADFHRETIAPLLHCSIVK
jgi:hypothetical protein